MTAQTAKAKAVEVAERRLQKFFGGLVVEFWVVKHVLGKLQEVTASVFVAQRRLATEHCGWHALGGQCGSEVFEQVS